MNSVLGFNNLFYFDFERNSSAYLNHAQICSWNQPVLSDQI